MTEAWPRDGVIGEARATARAAVRLPGTILKAQGREYAVRVRWLRPRQGLFSDWLRDWGEGPASTGARTRDVVQYVRRRRGNFMKAVNVPHLKSRWPLRPR
jgi:hypothetical protein